MHSEGNEDGQSAQKRGDDEASRARAWDVTPASAAYGYPIMSDAWTCLVTGGAGFIGSSLVDALIEQGHEVNVLDDLSTGYAVQLNPEARLIIGSVDDLAIVRTAVDGCDVVFHQAAHRAVLRSVEHPLATDSANTHGTLTVLDAARHAGVRRVVYASSSSVYGGAEVRPTPESAPLEPKSPYAVSKLAAEHYCRVFTELYGIETFALRYFNVYGPRQRPGLAVRRSDPALHRRLADGTVADRARRR